MNLGRAPSRYEPGFLDATLAEVEAADRQNHKRDRDVQIVGGRRLVLASPDGTLWSITVSNAGVVGATAL